MKIFLFFLILFILYTYFYKSRKEKFLKKIENLIKKANNKNKNENENKEFVLDVVCRAYIEKNKAISIRVKGKEYFFCSKDCLEKFLKTID